MHLLYSILYGLVSGLGEFLPVSAQAHQLLLQHLFGKSGPEPLRQLLVHIAVLAALLLACRQTLKSILTERGLAARARRTRGSRNLNHRLYDLRIVKTAAVPMIVLLLLTTVPAGSCDQYLLLALFLVINGVVLYIPEHVRQGNKEARHMTGLDGVLIGTLGGLSSMPGISRVGMCTGAAVLRGADKRNAINWALLLSIPAIAILCIFDIVSLVSAGIGVSGFAGIFGCILSALVAFGAGFGGVNAVRFLSVRSGYAGFAYYCWGAAFFAVLLYLIT